jgi:alpha-tubulin suppressor-like RCC1 family protein
MAPENEAKRPLWKRNYTVASFLLVLGVFASAVVGTASGSTITREPEQKLAVEQLVVANDVSYLLNEKGEVYSQGLNNFGQLGTNSLANTAALTRVKFSDDAAQPAIVKLSTQGEQVIALDSNGGLWTWGAPMEGALGNGAV